MTSVLLSCGMHRCYLVTSLTVIMLILQFDGGGGFKMKNNGLQYVMNAGDPIELNCEFETRYFNLFDNPVLWIKAQYHEESRINIMGNLNDPFVGTKRFKVDFLPSPPSYRLVLKIKDLSLEDSGNYTCEVRGPDTTVLAVIVHKLFIRAPVQDVILSKDNCTHNCVSATPPTLSFVENEPSLLQCVATGGNPPPELKIYKEAFDITYRFKTDTYTQLVGEQGLRIMHSSVHTYTNYLVLDSQDDRNTLKCTAIVPGLPNNITRTTMNVLYSPQIKCASKHVHLNDRNVHVTCVVTSQPKISTLLWIINNNGTTISQESQVINEYWMIMEDEGADTVCTRLYMKQATMDRFKTYTVVAENSIGINRQNVKLLHKNANKEQADNDFSQYNNADDLTQGRADYIFIPAGNTARHLVNIILLSTFQICYVILSIW